MNNHTIGDVVKLKDGREVKILNLPTSYMANGSYEVAIGDGTKKWVKPEEILYEIKVEHKDDLNNYFEVIMDETGINLIPKGLTSIELESDREDVKRIKLTFTDGRKHTVTNIHIGDIEITDKEELTTQPPPIEKKSGIKKYLDNISKDE